jgi:hypothetical protein
MVDGGWIVDGWWMRDGRRSPQPIIGYEEREEKRATNSPWLSFYAMYQPKRQTAQEQDKGEAASRKYIPAMGRRKTPKTDVPAS